MSSADALRLLIVDDDEKLLHSLKGHFDRAGFEVRTASNANSAFEIVGPPVGSPSGWSPDVVLSDYQIGTSNGCDVLAELGRRARRHGQGIRLYLMTGMVGEIPFPQMKAVDAVFRKPFEVREVLAFMVQDGLISEDQSRPEQQ